MKRHVPTDLLDSLVAYFEPRRVILFGSRARGEAGPDSDYDLLVVLDDDVPPNKLSWRARWEARKAYHGPVDIISCRTSVFERKAPIVGTLANVAATEGVVVYERDG